ncbi:MAG: penicillin acylase family protein, partial [Pseudomonas mandelii]
AQGLLSFSQSSDPASAHYRDQALLFSQQNWPVLPFSEAQIQADVALEHKTLRE